MPVWIPEYLKKNVTETNNAQTLYIDLPKNDQISFIQLEISAQGAAAPRELTTLIDKIPKYEVLADGSKTIYNCEPEIAYWIDYMSRGGVLPPMGFNYTPNARETHQFIIPFGRYPFDEEYMLDTSLYDSVQLRIPYDISDAVFTDGTFRTNIVMWRPLEKISPMGFIRTRNIIKEYASAAIQVKEHDLPMSYPLRYIGARFEDIDANIVSNCSAIKLHIDEGRVILLDQNINEIRDFEKVRFPPVNHYIITGALSNETMVKSHIDQAWPKSIVSSGIRALMFKIYSAVGEEVGLNIYEQDGVAVADTHAICIKVNPPCPHKCLTLYDGRKEPFNAPAYSQGVIEYSLLATAQYIHTFVQEVVTGKLL